MPKRGRHNWREPPEGDRTAFIYDSDEGIQTVIGNPDQPGFAPEISLRKWDGECVIKLLLPSPPSDRVPIIDQDQNIEIDYNSHRHRWFVKNDDNQNEFKAFEWEIIFPSKPLTNVIQLDIETTNLEFLYQGPLSQKEIDHGAERPENVVGSYAVYHSSKAHGKYKTGKICHIYRPKLIDALNNEAWCDIFIDPDAGIFRLTMPQSFLDTAIYPIIIDPTFGYTSLGASEVGVGPTWTYVSLIATDYYTASSGDNVNELFVGMRSPNASGDDMALAIYTVDGGAPDSKVMESSRFSVSNVKDWYSVSVDQDLTDGVTYCIAAGEFSTGIWNFSYDTQANAASEDGSTFPDTWSGVAIPHRFSIYAEYIEAGGVTVTPAAASAIAGKADPTVILGSMSFTPSPASAIGAVFGPTVIEGGGIIFSPDPASAVAAKNDPTVILGSISLTPDAISAIGASAGPTVVLGSLTLTPTSAAATGAINSPVVILGSVTLTPEAITAIADRAGPTLFFSSTTAIPDPAAAVGAKLDPSVILGSIAITPNPVVVIGDVNGPTVLIGVLVTGISLADIAYGAGLSASDILKGSSKVKNIQYGPGLTIEED